VKVADAAPVKAAPVKADGVKAADAAAKAVGAVPVKVDGVKAADDVVRAVDAALRVGAVRAREEEAPAKADEVLARAASRHVIRRRQSSA